MNKFFTYLLVIIVAVTSFAPANLDAAARRPDMTSPTKSSNRFEVLGDIDGGPTPRRRRARKLVPGAPVATEVTEELGPVHELKLVGSPTDSEHRSCLARAVQFLKEHYLGVSLAVAWTAVVGYQLANIVIPACNVHHDDYDKQACDEMLQAYVDGVFSAILGPFGFSLPHQ